MTPPDWRSSKSAVVTFVSAESARSKKETLPPPFRLAEGSLVDCMDMRSKPPSGPMVVEVLRVAWSRAEERLEGTEVSCSGSVDKGTLLLCKEKRDGSSLRK